MLQVRDLEGELEGKVKHSAEAQREARRLEGDIKELTYQVLQENTLLGWVRFLLQQCVPSSLKWPPGTLQLSLSSGYFLALSELSRA